MPRPNKLGRVRSLVWAGMMAATLAVVVAACEREADSGADGGADEPEEAVRLEILVTPTDVPYVVAEDQGLLEGVELDYTPVGYGEEATLFLAGDMPVGTQPPQRVAEWVAQGEDVVYVSNVAGLNFWNGLVIRSEDSERYQTIPDLVGQTLGQPGFGSGTWLAFEGIASSIYGLDARNDFDVVESDAGALLALLATGEIEVALSFAGQAVTATVSDDMELITSFTQEWQEAHGHPLAVTGLAARRSWLEEGDNIEVVRRLVEGLDRGIDWMKDHPEEFMEGGDYADMVEGQGWLTDEATNEAIIDLLQDDQWYFTSDTYTDAWIDSTHLFLEDAVDPRVEALPAREEIFLSPDQLQ